MSWVISNNYPINSDSPDILDVLKLPHPTLPFSSNDSYPNSEVSVVSVLIPPFPICVFLSNRSTFNGYPYTIDTVDIIQVFTAPGPNMFVQENDEYPKLMIGEATPADWNPPEDPDDNDEPEDPDEPEVLVEGDFTHPNLYRRLYIPDDEEPERKYTLKIYNLCSYRTTEIRIHDEESTECEIP